MIKLEFPLSNIGRFENYKNAYKKLYVIKVKKDLMSSDHSHWSNYYSNKKVRDKVYKLYKRDFDLLKYPKKIS